MIDTISWITVYPEIVLMVMACAILLIDLGVKTPLRNVTYVLTMLTLATVAAMEANLAVAGQTYYGFGNMVVSDAMGNWLKCFASIAVMVSLVYARPYAGHRDMLRGGELFTLNMLSLLGMFVMISSNNLLLTYMGLELLTLSTYALVALRRDNASATEAAMKYFVLVPWLRASCCMACPCCTALPAPWTSLSCSNPSPVARSVRTCWCLVWFSSLQVWHSSWVLFHSTCGFLTCTKARLPL